MTQMLSTYFSYDEVKCKCADDCGTVPGPKILQIADKLREAWGSGLRVTSGARCEAYTKYLRMHGIPAALRSAHIDGLALDLRPVNGRLIEFRNFVSKRLEELDIRMESELNTLTWVHIDCRPVPKGGKRVFIP